MKNKEDNTKENMIPQEKKDISYKEGYIEIDEGKYPTFLNRKYLNRKPYTPPNPKNVMSFMPGNILKVFIKNGDKVQEGDQLFIFEAMKMNNVILAGGNYKIKKLHIKEGEKVAKGQLLIEYA